MRPRCMERLWADSNLTFCHSRVLAACSAGIGPRWTERSMGIPAAMRLCRKPGASVLGHFPRCRERVRCPPMRRWRRLISTSSGASSSASLGEPPRAEASSSIRSVRPVRACTDRPALDSTERSSSARSIWHMA